MQSSYLKKACDNAVGFAGSGELDFSLARGHVNTRTVIYYIIGSGYGLALKKKLSATRIPR